MDFKVRKLTANTGAEVTRLDLRQPLAAETMATLRAVWLEHVVVVMPGQAIDDDQQIAFSQRGWQAGTHQYVCPTGARQAGDLHGHQSG